MYSWTRLDVILLAWLLLTICGCQSTESLSDKSDTRQGSDNDAQAAQEKGRLLASQGDLEGAVAEYTRAVRISPKSVEVLIARARFFEKAGKLDKAIADWDQVIWLSKGRWEYYRNRANLYMQREFYNEALTDYSLAISANPECLELYSARASAYQMLGKTTLADVDFQKARGGTPDPHGSSRPVPPTVKNFP